MQANEPITIRRAQNGFIVFGVANTNTTSDFVGEDTMVFNTMEQLIHFIRMHFEIRTITKAEHEADCLIAEASARNPPIKQWGVNEELLKTDLGGP